MSDSEIGSLIFYFLDCLVKKQNRQEEAFSFSQNTFLERRAKNAGTNSFRNSCRDTPVVFTEWNQKLIQFTALIQFIALGMRHYCHLQLKHSLTDLTLHSHTHPVQIQVDKIHR